MKALFALACLVSFLLGVAFDSCAYHHLNVPLDADLTERVEGDPTNHPSPALSSHP